ncbi:MAG TPA: ADP-forming succinate--CoA ligase subunit beta [Ghiorsea sp.]|nr:ADP-forming succinate--CoA ligase subunit beta [Ghiorsea sp.]HIP07357.1 ADP-forming succinate--CoA ligase subunit beta [Mariprofundaceae bacterium]
MNIHEYQAKALLTSFGITTPKGTVIFDAHKAKEAAKALGGDVWAVKAQIHAGGRGKAGGVRICKSLDELQAAADDLMGSTLVTHQTGAEGKQVHRIYIESGVSIAHEYYLSLLVDREYECISFVVSPDGGMDIEKVAAETPERLLSVSVDMAAGLSAYHIRNMAFFLGFKGDTAKAFGKLVASLYAMFNKTDASLLELNPLVLTTSDEFIALDAKFSVDDNALYRQADILTLRDLDEEDLKEIEASKHGLNYIALDGSIGCMVNGAGLAMATMDMIQLKGKKPANFLDVGGGVTVETVKEAFILLFSDKHVKAVLVNIFGGIVRCDIIAQGLLEAIKTHPMQVPVIMRLVGTNEKEGQQLIADAGLNVKWAKDLDEAATLAAEAV